MKTGRKQQEDDTEKEYKGTKRKRRDREKKIECKKHKEIEGKEQMK